MNYKDKKYFFCIFVAILLFSAPIINLSQQSEVVMLNYSLLNSDILRVLSKLGHTDRIVICDAGLPIPDSVERIDLALIPGLPSFVDVLSCINQAMKIEKVILAEEIKTYNEAIHSQILEIMQKESKILFDYTSHSDFKTLTGLTNCKAIIRTGECSPYANIILESGVIF